MKPSSRSYPIKSFACWMTMLTTACWTSSQESVPRPPEIQILSTMEENGGFGFELHRVTVAGTAKNVDGMPIVNAEIFIADSGSRRPGGFVSLLGSTQTDGQGRFVLSDIPLLVLRQRADPLPKPIQAEFTLFGVARGYGMTWTDSFRYRPYSRPNGKDPVDVDTITTDLSKYINEPIEIEIQFDKEAKLSGRITNDLGEPIANAKIQIGQVDDPRNLNGHGTFGCSTLGNEALNRKASAFRAISFLPSVYREARTDQDGYYFLNGLRRESTYIAAIDAGLEYDPWGFSLQTTATSTDRTIQTDNIGYEGKVDHVFDAPRDVFIEVLAENTALPVSGVVVSAHSSRHFGRSETTCTTDENGVGLLRLRPDNYTLFAEPNPLDSLVTTKLPLQVGHDSKSMKLVLPRASELNIKVLDDQGIGIPNVSFLLQPTDSQTPIPLSTDTVFSNYAKTNTQGQLKAIVVPGKLKLSIELISLKGYTPTDASKDLELVAGKSSMIEFRVSSASSNPESSKRAQSIPEEIIRRWSQQSQLCRSTCLRFSTRRRNNYAPKISAKDLLNIAQSFDEQDPDKLLSLLEDKIGTKLPLARGHVTIDGARGREDWLKVSDNQPQPDPNDPSEIVDSTYLYNGKESLAYFRSNHQIDLYGPNNYSVHVRSLAEILHAHVAEHILAANSGIEKAKIRTTDKRLVISIDDEAQSGELAFDAEKGMLLMGRSIDKNRNAGRNDFLFLPHELPNGLVIPRARLQWQENQDKVTSFEIEFIDHVEIFSDLPPETFALQASYGALILDYRNQKPNQPRDISQTILRSPVRDVISYLNQTTTQAPRAETRPEYGKPAPKLAVSQWCGPDGESQQPDWVGKILLVEFWGMSCGPCISSIPRVREAAQFFGDKNVAVLSIHESGTTIGELKTFAKKHNIDYPIGIDLPSQANGWFGETMRNFSIRGIPGAAVIDTQGNLVFIGDLNQAIQAADRLTKQEP